MKRDEVMLSLFLSGKCLREVGEIYGVTRERIRQIITVFPEYEKYKRGKDIRCVCGKVFYVIKSQIGHQKFCSSKCNLANRKSISLDERFWVKVDIRGKNDCWEWKAMRGTCGYGKINLGRKIGQSYAHRVCWELTRGEIPKGMHVLHHCDNPPCVNPDHLWIGTHQDNIRDRGEKGRTYTKAGGYLKDKIKATSR